MTYQIIKDELMAGATPQKAADLSRFFKTEKGQYGEGDQFMGVTVPVIRQIVKKYKLVERDDIQKLLQDPYHECRMIALQLLVNQYATSINEFAQDEVAVYPNPASDVINVANAENAQVSVFDMTGKVVANIENASANQAIDASNFAKGLYIVRVVDGNNIVTKKISIVK